MKFWNSGSEKCGGFVVANFVNFPLEKLASNLSPKTPLHSSRREKKFATSNSLWEHPHLKKVTVREISSKRKVDTFRDIQKFEIFQSDAAFLLTIESFLLTIELLCLQLCFGAFFAYIWSFSSNSWSFYSYSGKVRLTSTSTDCEQRSSTVSKKAPTVSKKDSPFSISQQVTLNFLICLPPSTPSCNAPAHVPNLCLCTCICIGII